MGSSSSHFVFVGSADGFLRAFRRSDVDATLSPAGSHRCASLSFFALGGTDRGDPWIFVSGKSTLEALVYSPATESFRSVSLVATSGSGTYLTVVADSPASAGGHCLFLAHYHEHKVSTFRFQQQKGWSDEHVVEPGSNPHQTKVRGAFVYVPCLGSNYVAQYRWVAEGEGAAPRLALLQPSTIAVPGGPRHMAFSPDGKRAFVLCELESRLETLEIESNGTLRRREDLTTFSHPDEGPHWSSDVVVSTDGAFAYALNRDPPELVTFSLAGERPERLPERLSLSAPVRSFSVASDGACLLVGGEDGVLWNVSLTGDTKLQRAGGSLGALRHALEICLLDPSKVS